MNHKPQDTDLLVIGGGINGVGVACDAAGRGLKVMLCEQNDLASATSSASSKLIHGGLRYLEHYEFRLVREALSERSALLDKAPHLVHPMRFVLPHHPSMRPAWMLSMGLFLYDHLAKFDPRLARSHRLNLKTDLEGEALNDTVDAGFIYSDCWVDDSRLVVANARAAADHGAHIYTRTQVTKAERRDGAWDVTLLDKASNETHTVRAKAIVNAAGPWTLDALKTCQGNAQGKQLRLVKGSHIVVDQLYPGNHAYILQNDDGRIVFVIPYHKDFTLIGTTEVMLEAPPNSDERLDSSAEETAYLCQTVNDYFKKSITAKDAVWSFAGVRPLFDDEAAKASHVTREYVLDLDGVRGEAPLLSIFGGKLTTYRQLSEKVLKRLSPYFPHMSTPWTAKVVLPGGGLGEALFDQFHHMYGAIDDDVLGGLANRHGDLTPVILNGAETMAELGIHFGAGLTAREVDYMIDQEWARTAEDVLWRRSKLGLRLNADQQQALADYIQQAVTSSR